MSPNSLEQLSSQSISKGQGCDRVRMAYDCARVYGVRAVWAMVVLLMGVAGPAMLLLGSAHTVGAGAPPGPDAVQPTGLRPAGLQLAGAGPDNIGAGLLDGVDLDWEKADSAVSSQSVTFDWSGTPYTYQVLVSGSSYTYEIPMSGTVDAENTLARTHTTVSLYQPNVSLKIENVGQTPVVNPKVIVNGKRNWSTIQDILDEVLDDMMSDKEKAWRMWYFVKEHHYHASPVENWILYNPVKSLNVYGYGECGDMAFVMATLWGSAGLPTRIWNLVGHVVPDVWYEGAYHTLDTDIEVFYLLPDNQTAASAEQVTFDHNLARRTHHYGRLESNPALYWDDMVASLYGHNDSAYNDLYKPYYDDHEISMTLKPRESFEWRWDNIGKRHDRFAGSPAPSLFANGKVVYEPALEDNLYRQYLESEDNILTVADDGKLPRLHLRHEGIVGSIVLQVESPYAIVGGTVSGEFYRQSAADLISIYISLDGTSWQQIGTANQVGNFVYTATMDSLVAAPSDSATYAYWIKLELKSDTSPTAVGMNSLRLETDVQMAPLSLPALELGLNTITYTDQTTAPHQVLVTHKWKESAPTRPPSPPTAPLYPADGSEINSTRFTFAWPQAVDPDGDAISDYHFFLSDRPDMAWPLSPNFDRVVVTRTLEVPYDGLLNDGTRYYWRVRSRDANGVWSDWSDTWSFVPHGPGAPLDLQLGDRRTLSWSPNPSGTVPLYYEVYGSNEKGFTPDNREHVAVISWQTDPVRITTTTVPSNLVATTTMTSFQVIQESPGYPNQNSFYYRVVAVDANGVRSAPTLQAAVDEQFIYTTPITGFQVGRPYQYQIGVIHSIEDMEYNSPRAIPYLTDVLSYSTVLAPEWMTIDQWTGLVSGTPASEVFLVHVQALNQVNQAVAYQSFWLGEPDRMYLPMVLYAASDD